MTSTPEALVDGKRIVVCVGTGGVGKTTVAATMALEAARRGRRALVLTIDPARRLADALGVEALGNEPTEVASERREELGITGEGRLFAMMLDMKRTFDDLVRRFGESPEAVDRILQNAIYQHVSDALAGSAEYAAMEKVYELCEGGAYDLVVVDTPPSQHALDFLEAPQRLLEFLDSRVVQMLVHPALAAGRFGIKLFQRTTQRVLQLFERLSGISFLEDVSEFLLAFEAMSEGFRERAGRVRAMLLGPDSGFVLVAGPSRAAARGASAFLIDLQRSGVPLVGVVINRVHAWPDAPPGSEPPSFEGDVEVGIRALERAFASKDAAADAGALAHAAAELTRRYASVVRLDLENMAPLRRRAEEVRAFFRGVPELPRDVHDIQGLRQVGAHLFNRDAEPDAAIPAATQARSGTGD